MLRMMSNSLVVPGFWDLAQFWRGGCCFITDRTCSAYCAAGYWLTGCCCWVLADWRLLLLLLGACRLPPLVLQLWYR